MNNPCDLYGVISKICPIHGCSTDGDLQFKDEATEGQRYQAQILMIEYLDNPSVFALNHCAEQLMQEIWDAGEAYATSKLGRIDQNLALKCAEKMIKKKSKAESIMTWLGLVHAECRRCATLAAAHQTYTLSFSGIADPTYKYCDALCEE